ncbi:hypothetical protein [Clostridium sp.]|uniref:fibronectin type III domain-containing protein n=1 Tax=Clostridium sp. TaxID=1506 RepID=UPI001A46DBCD|nr:hypothetical protein [Clostridium sp.]MBK5236175.1 hypothetical protein [Clostridium sp.]
MKVKTTIVRATVITLVVLLCTNIGVIVSKAEEPVKNNLYIASQKTLLLDSSKLAHIAANIAKKEEIDAIAVKNPNTTKEADKDVNLNLDSLTTEEADKLAKLEENRLATLGLYQTVIGAKLSTYLSSADNISSVLNRAVVLHGGISTNTCVYFSSEAMRRIGITVPLETCNTRQYLIYLSAHAWVSSYDIKTLTPGSICFTTPSRQGYPTHSFVFMGWVTQGDYTLAYVADNQGNAVHVRNMGSTIATDAFYFYMHTPTIPTKIAAVSSGYNSINVSWNPVNKSSIYGIYRATSPEGTYTLIATTATTKYNNTGLTNNKFYYYKVRAYKTIGTIKSYSGLTEFVSAKPILTKPISVKAVSSSYSSINISWNAVTGASKYGIYRAPSSEGPYTLISSTTTTLYNNTGLTTNNEYYYRVRAYKIIGKDKIISDLSAVISSTPIPSPPTNFKATRNSSKNVKLTWSPVAGATGYEIYTTISSTVPYIFLINTTNSFYTNSDLVPDIIYYYKIRSYRVIDETRVYGNWAAAIYSKP